MREDNSAKLCVGSLLCTLAQRHHLLLELTALVEKFFNKVRALLLSLVLEFLTGGILGVTLLISVKVQVVADLLDKGRDAATRTEAAQKLEDVAISHILLL